MKTSTLLYILGLVLIAGAIMLIVFNPDSERAFLISGGLTLVGFPLNIAGFVMSKAKSN
mgnify:CR=1 FL=1